MKRTRFLFLPALAILILLVGLLGLVGEHQRQAHAAAAKKLTVANCRTDIQLQQVITIANRDNADDTITFRCSGDILLSKTLTITGSMTLDGSGQTVTLDGNNSVRVLFVSSQLFTLNALTIAHGSVGSTSNGGGLANSGSTVNISNSTFANNSAGGVGGGLLNFGTVNISNSTFANNSATGGFGGGLLNEGTASISNSTFANNSATNNSDGFGGGGLYNAEPGTVTIDGSIMANNTTNFNIVSNCSGDLSTITSTGYNLESDTSCHFTSTSDLPNTDPKLNGLGSNGGPTQTMALQQGSPAIDYIPLDSNLCPSTDQRGNPRPDDPSESACDIGAYESSF